MESPFLMRNCVVVVQKEYSPSGEGETIWDLIHAEQRTVSAPHDVSEVVEDVYWPTHRDDLTAVSEVMDNKLVTTTQASKLSLSPFFSLLCSPSHACTSMVLQRCAKGGPKGCCCKARATWRFEVRMEEEDHAVGLIRDLKRVQSTDGFCIGLSDAGALLEPSYVGDVLTILGASSVVLILFQILFH